MTDDIEWGPWIDHDGKAPFEWQSGLHIWVFQQKGGRSFSPYEMARDVRSPDSPCWFWEMKRGPWPWSTPRPVCHDPAYSPIIRYRWGKPRARSQAVERLADLVASPDAPIPAAPEGPKRERVD